LQALYNNTVRTSANGIKFGTASNGGFKNITIVNNTVFDTYRSAITFAAVDGGFIENIVVDSLRSLNTGNVTLTSEKEDYRTAIVLDDVQDATFTNLHVEEPGKEKDPVYSHNSENIEIK